MSENVFELLLYLYEHYLEARLDPPSAGSELEEELLRAGFPDTDIDQAVNWLQGVARAPSTGWVDSARPGSIRLFQTSELRRLDAECRGFLLFVEQAGILTPASREVVLDRVMALGGEALSLDQFKWLILIVLAQLPDQAQAHACMEDLIFDEVAEYLH